MPSNLIKLAAGGNPPIGIIGPKTTSGYNPSSDVVGTTTKVLSNVIAIITVVAGLTFIYYFMVGAINWITAGGEAQKATTARVTILNALVGLAITVVAYPAILVISRMLGMPLANPAELFNQLVF